MPHVVIAGAPTGCWTNLGDEAILAGMVEGLRAEIDGVAITVVSSSPPETYGPYGCESVRYDDPEAVAAAVARADAVLLGGGSIFFDYWGASPRSVLGERPTGLALWATLALLAAADGIPVMTYDVGLTPLGTADGTLLTRAVLEVASAVTVRDGASIALASAMGVRGAQLTGDPAVRVELARYDGVRGAAVLDGVARPVLGVSVREWKVGDAFWEAVAGICDAWVERRGGSVVFVPCHRAVDWPLTDDVAAAQGVIGRMKHAGAARSLGAESGWAERAAVLEACDSVLAMRYHAALFAMRAGVPTVGLSYDAKVAGLFAEFGVQERCFGLSRAVPEAGAIAQAVCAAGGGADEMAGAAADAAREMGDREVGAARVAAGLVHRGQTELTARGASYLGEVIRAIGDGARPAGYQAALGRLAERIARGPGRRKTVAILTNRLVHPTTAKPQIGGAERYALELARLLRDLGLDVTFYQGGGEFEVADYFGFPVHPLAFGEAIGEFQTGIGTAFHERTADADHVLYLMPNYAAGPIRADAVVVSHGVWWDHDEWPHLVLRTPEWYAQLERVFTAPRRVISVDANTRNVVAGMYPAAGETIRYVPSAVDTDVFHPPRRREERDEPVVLFPRRAETVRGSGLVGPILDLVPDPARFVWVGAGSKTAELRAVAERDERLTVTTAAFDRMPKHYRDADIVVIPTIGSEGQSLSALEAMASGCAVIVSRIGGLTEVVTDGVDGLVCDPTAESLAAAIRRLVRDPGLRARLGAAARQTALRHDLPTWRTNWTRELAELGWTGADSSTAAAPYDVIKFAPVDFDYRYQRPQQTAVTWGRRGRRVFYVQRGGHRLPKGQLYDVQPVAENVYAVRLGLPAGFQLYQQPPDKRTVRAALRALEALAEAWHIEAGVCLVEFASWWPIARAARRRFGWPVHYDCMDIWSTFPAFRERTAVHAVEPGLVRGADSMTVTARAIQRHWAAERSGVGKSAAMARNAADFEFFHRGEPGEQPPEVLRKILERRGGGAGSAGGAGGTKVAGFIGAVESWIDQEIIRRCAEARPDVQFVFVGGVVRTSVEGLAALDNVHFVGLQPYADMPRFVRAFDVCLVPFIPNEATASMDLVKVYEYLASGRPIVSTHVAEMVRYGRYLYLAADADEFVAQLDRALAEDDPAAVAARVTMARLNSWDERVDVIESEILPTLSRVGSRYDVPSRVGPVRAERKLARARRKLKRVRGKLARTRRELRRYRASRLAGVARGFWRVKAKFTAAKDRGGNRTAPR